MADEIRAAIERKVARASMLDGLARAYEFRQKFDALLETHVKQGRWVAYDRATPLITSRPSQKDVVGDLDANVAHLTDDEQALLEYLGQDPRELIREANTAILRSELKGRRTFFDRVEKSPLTTEQARAVITFDNRVRVIAAAGSGKTSVMVARAAYAIERGFVAPERILMLAFNADAAAELQERVGARLGALGLSSDGLRASTFHAFGRSLIGQVTARKPSIAPWVESGRDAEKIGEIVDELRDSSQSFRFQWDSFRLLYARMSEQPDGGEPDSYDRSSRLTGFGTCGGETVRSEGERLIADWLFFNGVEYRYEQPYSHQVADSTHAQYRPDFYYPDVNVWHEHWALRADGSPPESFRGYRESMAWKKRLHAQYGTTLVETKWHEIIELRGFDVLAKDLERLGIQLDWNPDRHVLGVKPMEHERLSRLVRTFMSHVKSGSLTRTQLDARLRKDAALDTPRTRLFLDLYWQIHERWERDLRDADAIDFDDMLIQAADLLERDPNLAAYDLVMVDEFQDTSHARARLTLALVAGTDKHLLAVGDDWQSINRFAGADLSVMTNFVDVFGPAVTERLQTTFRCTQTIADVSSRFVSRNPSQIQKTVTAATQGREAPVVIVRVPNRDGLPAAIARHLQDLSMRDPGSTVDVLGRYRHEQQLVPRLNIPGLKATFRTIHRAKGLEADYVVLPNMTTGTYGFPSQIADDPVLAIPMADGDEFKHSEERRLFYVALTRARRQVTLFTVEGLESPFVVELLDDPGVEVEGVGGSRPLVRVCPTCGKGTLVARRGAYGEFLGCSRFPKCRHTAKI